MTIIQRRARPDEIPTEREREEQWGVAEVECSSCGAIHVIAIVDWRKMRGKSCLGCGTKFPIIRFVKGCLAPVAATTEPYLIEMPANWPPAEEEWTTCCGVLMRDEWDHAHDCPERSK